MQYTEQDFRDYGEDQGFRWDEGHGLDALISFKHKGMDVVNPYSHTQGDPGDMFGAKFDTWKSECVAEWAEFETDNAR